MDNDSVDGLDKVEPDIPGANTTPGRITDLESVRIHKYTFP